MVSIRKLGLWLHWFRMLLFFLKLKLLLQFLKDCLDGSSFVFSLCNISSKYQSVSTTKTTPGILDSRRSNPESCWRKCPRASGARGGRWHHGELGTTPGWRCQGSRPALVPAAAASPKTKGFSHLLVLLICFLLAKASCQSSLGHDFQLSRLQDSGENM